MTTSQRCCQANAKGRLPIVVMTADAAPALRDECLAPGADEFVQKQIQMDDLFAAIGRASAARQRLPEMA